MTVVGNGNIGVDNSSASHKPGQTQMAGAMSQQGSHVMGDNECAPQKLVRLVGCRVRPEKPAGTARQRQFGQTQR